MIPYNYHHQLYKLTEIEKNVYLEQWLASSLCHQAFGHLHCCAEVSTLHHSQTLLISSAVVPDNLYFGRGSRKLDTLIQEE
jgi:hypothetical protein